MESKLDRSFASASCLDFWDMVSCLTLSINQSDHKPLLLTFEKDLGMGPRLFWFQSMWTIHNSFLDFSSNIWTFVVYGNPMLHIMWKFNLVKAGLKKWNLNIFVIFLIRLHKKVLDYKRFNIKLLLSGFLRRFFGRSLGSWDFWYSFCNQKLMLWNKAPVK